uniref:Uncharacterized protein n=1 Tax=Leersia perrieri TaxID=77586 RepID=A0A0D9XJ88_9ORYZ
MVCSGWWCCVRVRGQVEASAQQRADGVDATANNSRLTSRWRRRRAAGGRKRRRNSRSPDQEGDGGARGRFGKETGGGRGG